MSQPDAAHTVCLLGFGAAIGAWLLHFLTASGDPPGFRIIPATRAGWVGYFFRTLILACVLSMFFARTPYIDPIVGHIFTLSTILLFVSSVVFSRSEPILSRIGLFLCLIILFLGLLSPSIATSGES